MTEYNFLLTVILFCLFLVVLWNLFTLKRKKYNIIPDEQLPFVSVLIPARNEEHNIGTVLKSLLNQNYPNYEIIVLDDNSEDKTSEIAQSISNEKIKVLRGDPLPEGWTGKNFACYQLYKASRGEYLLFTDADTIHKGNSIRESVTAALREDSDLLTLLPHMIMKTLSEKIIMPMLYFTVITLLPFYFVNRKGFPLFSIGIGPFMLFRRKSYEKIGGHEAVKAEIVEDVSLARNIKKACLKLTVIDGKEFLSVRMYRNLKEIWEGFSKNIFAGFNYSSLLFFTVNLIYLMLFFLPFMFLIISLTLYKSHEILLLTLIQISLIYFSRILISLRFCLGLTSSVFQPLGSLVVFLIGLNSWRWMKYSGGSRWKGRIYKGK
ncbi:MAG: glycosyltransferase family 2 protein [Ignavibacteria bacterium]|nr:glycosyltransferase family 2 protein [Ignavibacteria bacterium]